MVTKVKPLSWLHARVKSQTQSKATFSPAITTKTFAAISVLLSYGSKLKSFNFRCIKKKNCSRCSAATCWWVVKFFSNALVIIEDKNVTTLCFVQSVNVNYYLNLHFTNIAWNAIQIFICQFINLIECRTFLVGDVNPKSSCLTFRGFKVFIVCLF